MKGVALDVGGVLLLIVALDARGDTVHARFQLIFGRAVMHRMA